MVEPSFVQRVFLGDEGGEVDGNDDNGILSLFYQQQQQQQQQTATNSLSCAAGLVQLAGILCKGTVYETPQRPSRGIRVLLRTLFVEFGGPLGLAKAPNLRTSDRVFDVDGILELLDGAKKTAEFGGSMPPQICQRYTSMLATCAPPMALPLVATRHVLVPPEFVPRALEWRRARTTDERLEQEIARTFRPQSQGGGSISNIINSGTRGGFVADHKKKKKKKKRHRRTTTTNNHPEDTQADTTIVLERSSASLTSVSQPDCCETNDPIEVCEEGLIEHVVGEHEEVPLFRGGTTTRGPDYLRRDVSSWFPGAPLLVTGSASLEEQQMDVDGINNAVESIGVESQSWHLRALTADEHRATDDLLLRRAARTGNPWVAMTWAERADGPRPLPCGCVAARCASAVLATRVGIAVNDCERPGRECHRRGHDCWTLAAFATDAVFGVVPQSLATLPEFVRDVSELRVAFLCTGGATSRDLKAGFRQPVTYPTSDLEANTIAARGGTAWAAAISSACASISSRRQQHHEKATWYVARCRPLRYAHEAMDVAFSQRLFARAEEIAVSFVGPLSRLDTPVKSPSRQQQSLGCVIREDGSRWARTSSGDDDTQQHRREEDDTMVPIIAPAALLFSDGSGWPCDVAWTVDIAGNVLGASRSSECGYTVPLRGKTSVVTFRDGGGDMNRTMPLLTGTMIQRLRDGESRDCSLVYPFAYLVLSFGQHAKARELRERRHRHLRGTRDGGAAALRTVWDELLCAASTWLLRMLVRDDTATAPKPGSPAFVVCLAVHRVLELALEQQSRTQTHSDVVYERGLACILQPHLAWHLDPHAAAVIMDGSPEQNNNIPKPVATAVWRVVEEETGKRRDDSNAVPFGVGVATVPVDRTWLNAGLVLSSVSSPAAAAALLGGITLFEDHQRPIPIPVQQTRGSLALYDPLCGFNIHPDEEDQIEDDGRGEHEDDKAIPDVAGETKDATLCAPNLRLLAEEYVRAFEYSGVSSCQHGTLLLGFLRRLEIARASTPPAVSSPSSLSHALRAACATAWKRGTVPICEMACTGVFCDANDTVFLADSPGFDASGGGQEDEEGGGCGGDRCTGCGKHMHNTSGVDHHLPAKRGPLAAELVHARNGMTVLPHALPTTLDLTQTLKEYQVAVVRHIACSDPALGATGSLFEGMMTERWATALAANNSAGTTTAAETRALDAQVAAFAHEMELLNATANNQTRRIAVEEEVMESGVVTYTPN